MLRKKGENFDLFVNFRRMWIIEVQTIETGLFVNTIFIFVYFFVSEAPKLRSLFSPVKSLY